MKKTFRLVHPKKKYPRLIEAVKAEIRKYVKRERRRELPKGVDFWDFDCRFGDTEETAEAVHLKEITAHVDAIEAAQGESFYVEIIAKPGVRSKRQPIVSDDEFSAAGDEPSPE